MARKVYSLRLSEDLLEELREKANHDGVTLTELAHRYLWQGLNSNSDQRSTASGIEGQESRRESQSADDIKTMLELMLRALLDHKSSVVEQQVKEMREEMQKRLDSFQEIITKGTSEEMRKQPDSSPELATAKK